MIVRDEGATFLLITQPDHARLAEVLVAAVQTEPPLNGPARDTILLATREHDNGWIEVDAEPIIDRSGAGPCDFMSGPAHVKHELWPRGVLRVARINPHAGALVAEHALTVYSYRREEMEWTTFFDGMREMRDGLLSQIGATSAAARDAFQAEYRGVPLCPVGRRVVAAVLRRLGEAA